MVHDRQTYPGHVVHEVTEDGVYTSDIPFQVGSMWVRRCTLGGRAWHEVLGTRGSLRQKNGKLLLDVYPVVGFERFVADKIAAKLNIEPATITVR